MLLERERLGDHVYDMGSVNAMGTATACRSDVWSITYPDGSRTLREGTSYDMQVIIENAIGRKSRSYSRHADGNIL